MLVMGWTVVDVRDRAWCTRDGARTLEMAKQCRGGARGDVLRWSYDLGVRVVACRSVAQKARWIDGEVL